MTSLCPACSEVGVAPWGDSDSSILIVGEFPGETEMETGRPFTGATGKVLKAEMRRAGIEYNLCRVTNLWLHEPNDNEDCLKAGLDIALDEAKGRKAILLIGSAVVEAFLPDYGVMEVCGLQVDSPMLSCDTVFAMVNPAIAFQPNRGIGEVRLTLEKFAAALWKKGLIKDE